MMSQKSTILIVDDEPIGRQLIDAILYKEGYDLQFAENGKEAFEKAKTVNPDLILMDVMMPEIDGFEVCQMLRDDKEMNNVPIILVTALDDIDSRIRGLEAGADDYISKPFDRLELLARIKIITRLNRYRKDDASADNNISTSAKQTTDYSVLMKQLAKGINTGLEVGNESFQEISSTEAFEKNKNINLKGAFKFREKSCFYMCGGYNNPEESILSFYFSSIFSSQIINGGDLSAGLNKALNDIASDIFSGDNSIKPYFTFIIYDQSSQSLTITGINSNVILIGNNNIERIETKDLDLKNTVNNFSIDLKETKTAPGSKLVLSSCSANWIEIDGTKYIDNLQSVIEDNKDADIQTTLDKLKETVKKDGSLEGICGSVLITGILL